MNYKQAEAYALGRLGSELPETLTYHSINHTTDVFESVQVLAAMEDITDDELKVLNTATLFHDIGFVHKYYGHEEEGCRIAREVLPKFGYTPDVIEYVCDIIMATKVPQSPKDHLAEILCDSDLDYLGRGDFDEISMRLHDELSKQGKHMDEKQWLQFQIDFMQKHHYHTASAIKLRAKNKAERLQQIKNQLNKISV